MQKQTFGDFSVQSPSNCTGPVQGEAGLEPRSRVPRYGVGLQFNPALFDWFPFLDQPLDAMEVLFDAVMGPLDGPGLKWPGAADLFQDIAAKFPLVGHSNYGGDFGFDPVLETAAARKHVPLARQFNVAWVSNHCFYSDLSWSDVWSSPLQFSQGEVERAAERARHLQALYGVPLAHENAAYYRRCPGSDLEEEEFLSRLVQRADTHLHLDIHNLFANANNHAKRGYSIERFLQGIPLDRVIVIHMAGGRWHDQVYHDLHDSPVPDRVWELLDYVLAHSTPGAVMLEYEAKSLYDGDVPLDTARSIDVILADLERARGAWDRAYGMYSRTTTRKAVS